jgi:chemotaxis protein CheC
MTDVNKLSQIQLDMLKETGNIGSSHAATAISQMIKRRIDISVPETKISKIEELLETLLEFNEDEKELIGDYFEISDPLFGSVLFLFNHKSALSLSDILQGKEQGETEEIGSLEKSSIMELGNIVVSAYANALSKMIDMKILLTPPSFVHSFPEEIIKDIVGIVGKDTTHAFIFDTEFKEKSNLFKSYFILMPSPKSLNLLIDKLIK